MSTESTPHGESEAPNGTTTPSVTCRVCGTEVPVGAFCGFCGAHLSPQPGNGPDWLRPRAYSAALGEHVLRLSVVSSLFPHLAHRSRAAFRMGFAALIVLVIVFALLRWQAPLVAVSSLGFPLLYLAYLEESDVYGDDDLPVSAMLLTAGLGVVLGVGWALWSGPIVARSYFTLSGLSSPATQLYALVIPVGGALLMLVPVVVVRLIRPRQLESLDGLLIGSLGTIAFTAAATLTSLVPQLTSGLLADKRFVGDLLIEAGIRGVAAPLTAAAAGGIVGAALWFTTGAQPQQHRRGMGVVAAVVVVLVVYAALGLVDAARPWPLLQLFLHLLIAVLAILAVRIAVHLALLHEAREEMRTAAILCAECHHVVPDMAFCPNCGTATRASSRSSRNERRLPPEAPTDATTGALVKASAGASPAPRPGYATPAASYPVPPVRRTSHIRLFTILGISLTAVIGVVVLVAWLLTPVNPVVHCRHPSCGRPPTKPPIGPIQPVPVPPLFNVFGARRQNLRTQNLNALPNQAAQPVQTDPRFPGPEGSWSVAYPAELAPAPPGRAVAWGNTDDGSQVLLFGAPAGDHTAQDVAQNLIDRTCPGATMVYEIPNAMIGYQHGYGVVEGFIPQSSAAQFTRGRVLAIVAIKNGIALGALALGPYTAFTPPQPDGHPSGADLAVAVSLGKFVNSFMWKGDPPR